MWFANFVEAPILAAFLLCCRSEKVGRFVPSRAPRTTSHHYAAQIHTQVHEVLACHTTP